MNAVPCHCALRLLPIGLLLCASFATKKGGRDPAPVHPTTSITMVPRWRIFSPASPACAAAPSEDPSPNHPTVPVLDRDPPIELPLLFLGRKGKDGDRTHRIRPRRCRRRFVSRQIRPSIRLPARSFAGKPVVWRQLLRRRWRLEAASMAGSPPRTAWKRGAEEVEGTTCPMGWTWTSSRSSRCAKKGKSREGKGREREGSWTCRRC